MITLYHSQTGAVLGTITEDQFQQLADHLEEEQSDDQDYYINQETLEMLQSAGISSEVLGMLQQAIAETGEADIQWVRA